MPGSYYLDRKSSLAGTLTLARDCHFFRYLFNSHQKTSFLAYMIRLLKHNVYSENYNPLKDLRVFILYHTACSGKGLSHLFPR